MAGKRLVSRQCQYSGRGILSALETGTLAPLVFVDLSPCQLQLATGVRPTVRRVIVDFAAAAAARGLRNRTLSARRPVVPHADVGWNFETADALPAGQEMAHEIQKLPFSLLVKVMAFSDDDTVSCLMKTSKYLHHHGARFLLDYGLITLSTDEDLRSIINFLCVQGGYRLRYLEGLEFDVPSLKSDYAKLLERLLGEFTAQIRLKTLHIQCMSLLQPGTSAESPDQVASGSLEESSDQTGVRAGNNMREA
ncbi:uncharacterized protein BXZ73DRAFT_100211 [Epithele typhae]|uniref:uncharacterized protein n=1 Tax=Epithele typhae TaxID=378194 RepID=UPI0020074C91|nr:uncharacterized protein BXZ73DRAFT_100211 [Epithele typhae]KAH9936788.1 hypothetical protein BXZ73DRAFT_100211 [Epithele typhae]